MAYKIESDYGAGMGAGIGAPAGSVGFSGVGGNSWVAPALGVTGLSAALGAGAGLGSAVGNSLSTSAGQVEKFLENANKKFFGSDESSSEFDWSKLLDIIDNTLGNIQASIDSGMNSYRTSALAAQKAEADYNRQWNAEQAEIARQFSHDEADLARQWQAQREDSAYQRLMKDLRRAGLNPILAYQHANPSTGSAQMATTVSASGTQANISSAKNADKIDLDELLPILVLPVLSSAMQALRSILK